MFAALQYDPVSRTLLDTDKLTKEREELRVHPQQLSFLLLDLTHKTTNSLSLFGSRGLGLKACIYNDIAQCMLY